MKSFIFLTVLLSFLTHASAEEPSLFHNALLQTALSYVGTNIAVRKTGNRTDLEQAQVDLFSRDSSAWCADIMKHYDEVVAEFTGLPGVFDEVPLYNTRELVEFAKRNSALISFSNKPLPLAGSIFVTGYAKSRKEALEIINQETHVGEDRISRSGVHAAMVYSSELYDPSVYGDDSFEGWVVLNTVDAFSPNSNDQRIYQNHYIYLVNPMTNEVREFRSRNSNEVIELTFGYIDPSLLQGASEQNERLKELLSQGQRFSPPGPLSGIPVDHDLLNTLRWSTMSDESVKECRVTFSSDSSAILKVESPYLSSRNCDSGEIITEGGSFKLNLCDAPIEYGNPKIQIELEALNNESTTHNSNLNMTRISRLRQMMSQRSMSWKDGASYSDTTDFVYLDRMLNMQARFFQKDDVNFVENYNEISPELEEMLISYNKEALPFEVVFSDSHTILFNNGEPYARELNIFGEAIEIVCE